MASDVWQALGLARQTGIEYWPGESVYYRGQLATVTRAVSTPRISVSRDAQGVTVGALECATAYDVQLVSGEILTAVDPADLELDELYSLLLAHDCRFYWDGAGTPRTWCLAGPREGKLQWETASFTEVGDLRDAKRAAIDYLKHEHVPERIRPARRSAE